MAHKQITTDVLVIGGGLAGMSAALEAAQRGHQVLILNKGDNASRSVLGFNAPISGMDSVNCYVEDTVRGGWQINDASLVHILAEGSLETIREMEQIGQTFDRENGEYHLLQPLGCSHPRLVHEGNKTGKISMELICLKLKDYGVQWMEDTMVLDLICIRGRVWGAWAVTQKEQTLWKIYAKAVVLATGGGHLFRGSTYPMCQTADGYAMAYRAGASLRDMEFVQFEPCRAIWPKPLGISTTLLTKGGMLKNSRGERFVLKHFKSEGEVPKDVLARLITLEILEGRGTEHGGVYLDLTGMPREEIVKNHSLYYERFRTVNIDLTKDVVEVGPCAHSMMGGVVIRKDGSVEGVAGMYAAGEVIGGLHGANRVGGNAGAETYVFGRLAGKGAAACASDAVLPDLEEEAPFWEESVTLDVSDFSCLQKEIRQILAEYAGPVRTGQSLAYAKQKLEAVQREYVALVPGKTARPYAAEAANMLLIAKLICDAADMRKESRGCHYRSDYPQMDDTWQRSILWKYT